MPESCVPWLRRKGRVRVIQASRKLLLSVCPNLVEKFIQAARKSNMEVYASGTFHFIWNRVANILSSRETDPVNVKTDVNFRPAREILARSFLLLEY